MDHRRLGSTGLAVSPIAFGAFKIGRNERIKYAQSYELPDEATASRLLNGVLDLGINLIDTAPAYGLSEARVGRAIAHRRHEFVLSSKVGETFEHGRSTFDYSTDAVLGSVERSLQRMRTEVLDLVFVHSNGDDLQILDTTDVVTALQSLRDRGLVRAIGFSGKTVEGARAALDWADALMIEYHADDTSHDEVMHQACDRAVGVIVKKPLASGVLDPSSAIRFALAHPSVAALVVGSLSLEHVATNLRHAST